MSRLCRAFFAVALLIPSHSVLASPHNLEVIVTSLCFDSSQEAKDANESITQGVLSAMDSAAVEGRDHFSVNHSTNIFSFETIVVDGAAQDLCELKWRTSTKIVFDSPSIEALQDLRALLEENGIDATLTAQTTLTF